jgi:3-oxoacyl-[acyl-carrier protein] reductase
VRVEGHAYAQKTFDVNVGGILLMMVEFVQRFGEHEREVGSIINLSTDSAQTFAGQINYGASKAAIEAFTRSVAIEAGSLGIRVNTIAPGPTQTGYISAEFEEVIKESIPLKRIGEPEDIADVAVFLASDQARWVTGQVIKVSGGGMFMTYGAVSCTRRVLCTPIRQADS